MRTTTRAATATRASGACSVSLLFSNPRIIVRQIAYRALREQELSQNCCLFVNGRSLRRAGAGAASAAASAGAGASSGKPCSRRVPPRFRGHSDHALRAHGQLGRPGPVRQRAAPKSMVELACHRASDHASALGRPSGIRHSASLHPPRNVIRVSNSCSSDSSSLRR